MDRARSENAWNHTAGIIFHMYRLHATGNYTPQQFHPHHAKGARGMRLADGFDLLREAWGVQPETP